MNQIAGDIRILLSKRKPDSHKGNYGRVFILAGSAGMSGAALLAAESAMRSGAGLVTLGIPKILLLSLTKCVREVMLNPLPETSAGTLSQKAFGSVHQTLKNQKVFAIGPGLSRHLETQKLIRRIVVNAKLPVVLDADGLNAFCGHAAELKQVRSGLVITPHPGEFTRLFGGPSLSNQTIRIKRSVEISRKYNLTVALKGWRTVVTSYQGDIYINQTGNPGMATAGSGDVLTGVIAAMIGQGLSEFDAARVGVYVHGLAGDIAKKTKGEISLIARDIIHSLPTAFQQALGR